jgi:Flp pilus assembly protein TadD
MPYTPLQLADAFIQTGELDDALDALTQPDDDSARRLCIGVRQRLGGENQFRAALTDFTHLITLSAYDHAQRSVILEQLGDLDGAVKALHDARTLDPANARHVERLLNLWSQHHKIAEALELVRAQPRTWRWLQWEGDLLVQSGENTAATARYGLALAQIDAHFDVVVDKYVAPIKARILIARAHAYRRLEQIDQAEAHYSEAQMLIPNEPTIPFYQGLLAFTRGHTDRAALLCSQALTDASSSIHDEMLELLQHDYPELLKKVSS